MYVYKRIILELMIILIGASYFSDLVYHLTFNVTRRKKRPKILAQCFIRIFIYFNGYVVHEVGLHITKLHACIVYLNLTIYLTEQYHCCSPSACKLSFGYLHLIIKGSRVSKVKIAGQAAKRMLKFMCVTCVHAFIRGISNKKSAENRQPQERERERESRENERERCKQV